MRVRCLQQEAAKKVTAVKIDDLHRSLCRGAEERRASCSKLIFAYGEIIMNGISTQSPMAATVVDSRRRRPSIYITGFMIRLVVALVISWLIIMAFFVTNVVSH